MNPKLTKTVLITGASRGLGLSLARALAQKEWKLILTARTKDVLESVRAELAACTAVLAIPGDVSDPHIREALANAARAAGGVLVAPPTRPSGMGISIVPTRHPAPSISHRVSDE